MPDSNTPRSQNLPAPDLRPAPFSPASPQHPQSGYDGRATGLYKLRHGGNLRNLATRCNEYTQVQLLSERKGVRHWAGIKWTGSASGGRRAQPQRRVVTRGWSDTMRENEERSKVEGRQRGTVVHYFVVEKCSYLNRERKDTRGKDADALTERLCSVIEALLLRRCMTCGRRSHVGTRHN